MPHEIRDAVVDYVNYWTDRGDVAANQILRWMNVPEGTFYSWKQRYDKGNEHNGWIASFSTGITTDSRTAGAVTRIGTPAPGADRSRFQPSEPQAGAHPGRP